jgi:hypothetical protein
LLFVVCCLLLSLLLLLYTLLMSGWQPEIFIRTHFLLSHGGHGGCYPNMSKDRFHSHFTTDLYNLPKLMEIQPTIHFPSSHGIRTSVARGQLLCFYPARIFPGATPVSELPLGDQLLTNEYENVYLAGGTPCCANTGFLK